MGGDATESDLKHGAYKVLTKGDIAKLATGLCPMCDTPALEAHCNGVDDPDRTCSWLRCTNCRARTDTRRAYRPAVDED